MTIKIINKLLLATLVTHISLKAHGQEEQYSNDLDHLSLSLEELGKIKVSIATGTDTPIDQAPAIASVITASDINAMGLKNLDEVLQTVPGLHVSVSPIAYTPIYTFRGIRGGLLNPQILMLVNGIPITSVLAGDRGVIWGGFPVEYIAQIEIIRGPGSALYGADAYAGVINVITKNSSDFTGLESGIRTGSFDSHDSWVMGSNQFGALKVSGYLAAGTTDGQSRTITSDSQSVNDAALGTNTSLAPDGVNTGYDSLDSYFTVAGDEWQFRNGINFRDNLESGAGVAQALDTEGSAESLRWTADLTYTPKLNTPEWQPQFQLSYMYYNEKSDVVFFPEGTDFTLAGGGAFTNGMKGNPDQWERHYKISGSTLYTGFEKHRLNLGVGYSVADLYKVQESRNYVYNGSVFPEPNATNTIEEVDSQNLFITPRKRELAYFYAQDEWSLSPSLTLTTGIRYDDYSDFGDTTNPRLALVWQASKDVTTKLLYGRAFRAPAFTELYNQGNPVLTGSDNLEPEKIESTEAAISWRISNRLSLGANIFHYKMTDIIRYQPNSDPTTGSTATNVGEQTGDGVELEFAWDPITNLRIQANYSHQKSTDEISGEDAGLAPENLFHLRSDWRFAPHWAANMQVNWVADRRREAGDTRNEIDDYTLVNFSLRTINISKHTDFTFSILNVFDEDAREPSSGGNNVLISNDLPLSGRAFFVKLTYRLL